MPHVHANNVRLTLPGGSSSGFADSNKMVSSGDPRVISGGLVSHTHHELTNFGHHAEDGDDDDADSSAGSEQAHGDDDGSQIHSHDTWLCVCGRPRVHGTVWVPPVRVEAA